LPARTLHLVLFAAMSAIWGLTWLATATGVQHVPPLFFAATRFLAAGILMLGLHVVRGGSLALAPSWWPRLAIAGVLSVSLTNGPHFWAIVRVESGLAAVMNLSLLPIMLLLIGRLHGEERFTWRGVVGIALGIAGLALLFNPGSPRFGDPAVLAGGAAILLGTICYAWGSVLNRPLLRAGAPLVISGWASLLGGIVLLAASAAIEPAADLGAFLLWPVLAGWLYLVIFGSVIAYTIFMYLLRDWGPSRAGLFSFISPIIAVLAGTLVRGERIGPLDVAAMLILLGAAWLAGRNPGKPG
jgi:drug/metabolite transporter (DMT)-like permease